MCVLFILNLSFFCVSFSICLDSFPPLIALFPAAEFLITKINFITSARDVIGSPVCVCLFVGLSAGLQDRFPQNLGERLVPGRGTVLFSFLFSLLFYVTQPVSALLVLQNTVKCCCCLFSLRLRLTNTLTQSAFNKSRTNTGLSK